MGLITKKQHILVTGANGYVGSVLVPLLRRKGYLVSTLDINYYFRSVFVDKTGNKIPHFNNIDIRDINKLNLVKYEAIIHLAALSNDPLGELDANLTYDINHKATIQLAKQAKIAGIKKFIFSSSCSVYGIASKDWVIEKNLTKPLTAYSKSKTKSESELLKLADKSFCVVIMRNATLCGFAPKFRDDLVVNNFVCNAETTGRIEIHSDGTPWRPLLDVHDLAHFFVLFLQSKSKIVNGETYNVGFNNSNYQVNDILELVKKQYPQSRIIYTGKHGADSRSYRVNFDKIAKLFPDLHQDWPLNKSIKYMAYKLKQHGYSQNDFINHKFSRLSELKRLKKEKLLDRKLKWH